MSDLTDARDHAQAMGNGTQHRPGCLARTTYRPKWCHSAECLSHRPRPCNCDPPDAAERRMWQTIADELDAYLDHKAANDDPKLPL